MTAMYPVPIPKATKDPRFSYNLASDVADVLERHGYPPVRTGSDLTRLQHHLFKFLYVPNTPSSDEPDRIGPRFDPALRHRVRFSDDEEDQP